MSRILTDAELQHYTEAYAAVRSAFADVWDFSADGSFLGTDEEYATYMTFRELPTPERLRNETLRAREGVPGPEYDQLVHWTFTGLDEIRRAAPGIVPSRATALRTLLAAFAPAGLVAADTATGRAIATRDLRGITAQPGQLPAWIYVLSAVSGALSAYHGYKRNGDSIGWGLLWGFLGGAFPIITPAVAYTQGFGKRSR